MVEARVECVDALETYEQKAEEEELLFKIKRTDLFSRKNRYQEIYTSGGRRYHWEGSEQKRT